MKQNKWDEVKEDVKNVELLSNPDQVRDFVKNSTIWRDMKVIMDMWLEDIKDALTDHTVVRTMEDVTNFQGGADVCREFLNLPDTMIINIELDKQNKGEQDGKSNKSD